MKVIMDIFELLYERYHIANKPIAIVELFAGIGSQIKALKRLEAKGLIPLGVRTHRICEFDKYAVASYNAIHNTNFETSDITKIHASDLYLEERERENVIWTYSFPCQDLSLAGLGRGLAKGSGTRSSLLWEVERLLTECSKEQLPNCLIMENVPQVIGVKNIKSFQQWELFLESLGYKNYVKCLNAKDYGIPQNRNRCFMVSILGDYYYEFPKKQKLKLKLKDMLETDVDEKYFLSQKMIDYVINRTPIGDKGTFANNIIGKEAERNAGTLTTKNSDTGTTCRGEDTFIVENMTQKEIDEQIYLKNKKPSFQECYNKLKDSEFVQQSKRIQEKDVCDTLCARDYKDPKCIIVNNCLPIKNATKQGYLLGEEGDGVDISTRMETHRGTVQKGIIQTLDTQCNQGVIVKVGNYSPSNHNASSVVDTDGIAPTVMENHGTVTAIPIKKDTENYIEWQEDGKMDIDCRAFKEDKIAPTTTTTPKQKVLLNDLRIRKLTPCECWLLMGFDREDYLKASKVNSAAQLYKQAGNSIVVNVLEAIFRELL